MVAIFGRDAEISALTLFLEEVRLGSRALVLSGEPGIGKTTVWGAGVDLATRSGYRVLSCRPAGSEAQLSYAALSDLIARAYEDVEEMPSVQRRSLDIVTLRQEPGEAPTDHRTVAAAVLTVLRHLCATGPVLIAIDDLQWIDQASAMPIAFCARRLSDEPVGILAALRTGEAHPDPIGLERVFAHGRLERRPIGPLEAAAVASMIAEELGLRLPISVIRRLNDQARGNPLFALELARRIRETGTPAAGDPIPPPTDLAELVRDRLSSLPGSVSDALLTASAMMRPTVSLVEATASRRSSVGPALRRAARSGLIQLLGDEIRFAHPLFASAAYSAASAASRRRVHHQLAEVVVDLEERARHLALSAIEPDTDIAAVLEKGAKHAADRGAVSAAADLYELAVRMVPPGESEERRRLQIQAADHRFLSGEQLAAVELLRAVVAGCPPGPIRAEALVHLGGVLMEEDLESAIGLLTEALRHEDAPAAIRARAAAYLSTAYLNLGRLEETDRFAATELELAELADDPTLMADALLGRTVARAYMGRGIDYGALRRADELAKGEEFARVDFMPARTIGELLYIDDRLDEARDVFNDVLTAARERGDEPSVGTALGYLARIEGHSGNWDEAIAYGEAQRALGLAWGGTAGFDTLIRAHRGELEEARRGTKGSLVESERSGYISDILESLEVLGVVELLSGRPAEARRHLGKAWKVLLRAGAGDPNKGRFVPDLVEALLPLGELEEAERLTEWLEERGRSIDRPRALATAARCRAQVLVAKGDHEGALASLDRAMVEHERLADPFELGRTLLVRGAVLRRTKQKRAARDALERARAIFDGLLARPWSDRAREELASVGGRPPAKIGQLTPTEERVAEFAAAGRTNREIAQALFVSERTVAGHLTHIYGKLGVRSRTELAHVLRADGADRDRDEART
jgi:DNA-binding CsgD family transcriptional regulator